MDNSALLTFFKVATFSPCIYHEQQRRQTMKPEFFCNHIGARHSVMQPDDNYFIELLILFKKYKISFYFKFFFIKNSRRVISIVI